MVYCGVFGSLIWFCVCLMLVIATVAAIKANDRRFCKQGPLMHYKALKCTPVYKYGCEWRYDCDHLYERIRNKNRKCYINGHEYNIGERLRKEDRNLCDKDCICRWIDGLADFKCKERRYCHNKHTTDGCFQRNPLERCCPTEEICPNDPEEVRSVCKENGNIYLPGEYMIPEVPEDETDKICICEGNKTGVSMFSCRNFNRWFDVHAAAAFYRNCAPVYLPYGEGKIGIKRETWRCQNTSDEVFDRHYEDPEESKAAHGPLLAMYCPPSEPSEECKEPSEPCKFINQEGLLNVTFDSTYRELCRLGQLTMHIGDILNNMPYGAGSCIICSCEVPPVPTCLLLPRPCS